MTPASEARRALETCFRAALAAVDPETAVERALSPTDEGGAACAEAIANARSVRLIAVGKAAPGMARAAAGLLGERLAAGVVVARAGQAEPLPGLESLESGHPVPDERALRAVRAIRHTLGEAVADERVLVLLSGGASALLSAPLPGLSLPDVIEATELLLASGAPIHELNALRKHMTALSGGRLARAAAGRPVDVIAISDVPGDDLQVIGSGPCAGDSSTYSDVLDSLQARELLARIPKALRRHLEAGARGEADESVSPDDPLLRAVSHHVAARNRDARAGAIAAARELGFEARDLGECLEGDASHAAAGLVLRARTLAGSSPRMLVAGGETTVHVTGKGRGGRNQEFALAAALELDGDPRIAVLAAGTDGSDGPTDAAGAFADGGTVERGGGRARSEQRLADNDSYRFFSAEGGLFRPGATGTNVMDLALVTVAPGSPGG